MTRGRPFLRGTVATRRGVGPLPAWTTSLLVAGGAVASILVWDVSALIALAYLGILVSAYRPSLRAVLMLSVAVLAHSATNSILGATTTTPVATSPLPAVAAIGCTVLTIAVIDLGTARTGVLAAVVASATALGVVIGAADPGHVLATDPGSAVALLALCDLVLTREQGRRGGISWLTRAAIVAGTFAPAAALLGADRLGVPATTAVGAAATLVIATLVTLSSVRENRTLQRSEDLEDLTQMFMESEDRGVLTVELDGTIATSNAAADEMLAGPGGSVTGLSVDAFVGATRAPRHRAERQDFRRSGMTRPMSAAGPVTATTLDGRQVVLRIAIRTLSGTRDRFICVIEDLTAQRAEADALRTQLERQRALVEQLHRLEGLRNGLLTAASHELRTPVTVLHGTAELLSARYDELDAPTVKALLDRQFAQSRKLAQMLDDLTALDPDGSVQSHPRALPLDRSVAAIVERWSRRNEDFPVTVLGHRTTGWADPSLLERIIEILLDNARAHGAAPVAVQVTPREGGGIVTVSDSGDGIPDQLHEEIFLPFGRGTSLDSANPGLGLGLPLARLLAEEDGGTLVAVKVSRGAMLELRICAPPVPDTPAGVMPVVGTVVARETSTTPATPTVPTTAPVTETGV